MIAMSRTVSAQPTAGVGSELDVIAAMVIGGVGLSGGRGTVTGTIVRTLYRCAFKRIRLPGEEAS